MSVFGPLSLGLAGAQMGMAFLGAQGQNRAIQSADRSANAAALRNLEQIRAATTAQRMENLRRSRVASGRTLVRAAESGLSIDGSVLALLRQESFDTARADQNLLTNDANASASVYSQLEAQKVSLRNQLQSPVMAAVKAGLGAASSVIAGFSMGGGATAALPTDNIIDGPGRLMDGPMQLNENFATNITRLA